MKKILDFLRYWLVPNRKTKDPLSIHLSIQCQRCGEEIGGYITRNHPYIECSARSNCWGKNGCGFRNYFDIDELISNSKNAKPIDEDL